MSPAPSGGAEWWDQRYSHTNLLYGFRPNNFLVEAEVMLPRAARVLVLGDGEGRNGVWLAGQAHHVVSVDFSGVAVQKARALADQRGVNVEMHCAELGEWIGTPAAEGPWDGVVSIFCHLAPELRRQVGEALTPRMKDRSTLIIESYTPAQLSLGTGGPRNEALLLTRQRVIDEWPGMALDIRIAERRVFEGMAHQGLSAVIQVLGQPRR